MSKPGLVRRLEALELESSNSVNSVKEKARSADLEACLKQYDAVLTELNKLPIAEQQQITNQAISDVLKTFYGSEGGKIE